METALGIGDIAVHIPRPLIPLATIIARHRRRDPQWARALERSRKRTGQVSLRFPQRWEDAATMAAQAAWQLVARMTPAEVASLRYLAVGTETGVDHSKPIAAHVQGMLQRAGCALPRALSTFDVQHACAGGAIGLVHVGAMLAMSRARGERGLLICTDEARYPRGSSAELTQGAAAVALLVEPGPAAARTGPGGGRLLLARRGRLLSSARFDDCARQGQVLHRLLPAGGGGGAAGLGGAPRPRPGRPA